MIKNGYHDDFTIVLHERVKLTKGSYCVSSDYYCICHEIDVPNVCASEWESFMDEDWLNALSRSSSSSKY